MNSKEELAEGDSLTEAVTKYAEIATQAEQRMAQMEANFEEKITMMKMQQLPQQAYFQQPPPQVS